MQMNNPFSPWEKVAEGRMRAAEATKVNDH